MTLAVDAHGRELAFDGGGGLHRQTQVAAVEGHHAAVGQALGHADHRNGQVLQQAVARFFAHQRGQAAAAESSLAPTASGPGPRASGPAPAFRSLRALRPAARRQATAAPADAPTIRSGTRPSSSSALSTPTCTKPRGPPELKTQAVRGTRGSGTLLRVRQGRIVVGVGLQRAAGQQQGGQRCAGEGRRLWHNRGPGPGWRVARKSDQAPPPCPFCLRDARPPTPDALETPHDRTALPMPRPRPWPRAMPRCARRRWRWPRRCPKPTARCSHARRQPREVAPGARDLVLRDLCAGALRARTSSRSTRPSACCSTATTTAWATSTRGPSAGWSRGPGWPRCWPTARRGRTQLAACWRQDAGRTAALVELGLQHEQQHQELLLTDVLHLLSCNPLAPVYRAPWPLAPWHRAAGLAAPRPAAWWTWGMPVRALPLTTKARATAIGCSPLRWPTGW
jgi:hypothetical protein